MTTTCTEEQTSAGSLLLVTSSESPYVDTAHQLERYAVPLIALVAVLARLPFHDAIAGSKAFRREALESIGTGHRSRTATAFQIENTWAATRLGLRITFTDGTVGTSKMTNGIVREAMLRVLTWRWRELTHRPDTTSNPARARESRRDVAV